jgi:hypothetical protein
MVILEYIFQKHERFAFFSSMQSARKDSST